VLCCAVALSDTHVLLLTPPANAGEPASAVVLDARYGSCLASLPLQLPGGTAGNDAAGTVQLLPLPPGAGATAALLAAGGVYLLHIPLPRADLAGLIGRLGLHAADAPGAPGGTAVTCGQQVDLGALAAAVVAGGGGSSSGGGGGGAAVAVLDCQLLPVPTGTPGVRPLPPGASAVRAAAEALAAVLAVQPPALEQLKSCVQELCTALQQQQQQHRKQQPSLAGSAAAGVQQQSLTPGSRKSRQQQAAAQAATQANGDDGVTGVAAQQQQQQHALLPLSGLQLSQHLLARALGALADAKAWPLLEQLHALQPLQSLGPCPGLLPALAAMTACVQCWRQRRTCQQARWWQHLKRCSHPRATRMSLRRVGLQPPSCASLLRQQCQRQQLLCPAVMQPLLLCAWRRHAALPPLLMALLMVRFLRMCC
jgi:hypothetical protein